MTGAGNVGLAPLDQARDVRVAVIGDFCLDAYWHLSGGQVEYSVESGLPIQRVASQEYSLGGAGNVVANLKALGVEQVRAIGVHGRDPFGVTMRALIENLGIDVTGLHALDSDWQTLVYAKPYIGGIEQQRLDFGGRAPLSDDILRSLLEKLAGAAEWAHVVVINQQVDSALALPQFIDAINAIVRANPQTLFLVDARNAAASYEGAMLKVNVAEAAAVVGDETAASGTDRDVDRLAKAIFARTAKPVFITRGERGIVAADHDGLRRALGIDVQHPIDPVGAGDTVVATIAVVFAAGGDVQTAISLANVAAAITVTKIHTTGTVSAAELSAAVSEVDYIHEPELAASPHKAEFIPGTEIEVVARHIGRHRMTHVIFDHDGTLSTLRQGWEEVMEPMMVQAILGSASVDMNVAETVRSTVRDFIDRTTGIQTLAQMLGLTELVRRHGLVPEAEIRDEHGYKAIYNAALSMVVKDRLRKLAAGQLEQQDFHVKGALNVLRALRAAGVHLYLASGTDEADVIAEAWALGFGEFFEDRIYGSVGDLAIEAKRVVMDRILTENALGGGSLATFGDGPVEMRETRRRGGLAIGICSDEKRRYGANLAKRPRLIRGGARYLAPDFSDVPPLLELLAIERIPTSTAPQPGEHT